MEKHAYTLSIPPINVNELRAEIKSNVPPNKALGYELRYLPKKRANQVVTSNQCSLQIEIRSLTIESGGRYNGP